MSIQLPAPALQVRFAHSLQSLRALCLQEALLATVEKLKVPTIDAELAHVVSEADLGTLARHGLRGESFFPVPCMLEENPRLLAYYRLLYGYSQKDFYGANKGFGAGMFKSMEAAGRINVRQQQHLSELCASFAIAGSMLLNGIVTLRPGLALLDDLTLLTVGPQLRGGANNLLGTQGIVDVFEIIREIVAHAIVSVATTSIEIRNAANRCVLVEFAPDPDIIIREEMAPNQFRNVVAIEVKAGTDTSNVHNRIGEAEKSHQKARRRGYTECWTVTNVLQLDISKAHSESPSTDRFYSLNRLSLRAGDEYEDFRRRVYSLTSIASPPPT